MQNLHDDIISYFCTLLFQNSTKYQHDYLKIELGTLTFLQQLLFPQQFLKMEFELVTMASDGEGDGGIEEARADGSGGP